METDTAQSSWNSLEVVKLAVGLITPIIIVAFGIWVTRLAEQFKASIWANQKVIEKRIAIYDELAPLLNDLFCYYYFVGNWKELSPKHVLDIKRRLDKRVYTYASMFSKDFKELYDGLINLCFEHYTGSGRDAKLRTSIGWNGERKTALADVWDDRWDEMFCKDVDKNHAEEIKDAYELLMSRFASELGIIAATEERGSEE